VAQLLIGPPPTVTLSLPNECASARVCDFRDEIRQVGDLHRSTRSSSTLSCRYPCTAAARIRFSGINIRDPTPPDSDRPAMRPGVGPGLPHHVAEGEHDAARDVT